MQPSSPVCLACITVAGRGEAAPDCEIFFFAPKPLKTNRPTKEFVIEPQDISTVAHAEAASDPLVSPVLSLGGPRDLQLIRTLWRQTTVAKLHA